MKYIMQGCAAIFILILTIIYMAGCVRSHKIIFLNEACIKPYQGYYYRTCDPMQVKVDGKKIIVPENFKTDLASIPRILWPIFAPQYSGFVAPAILHDYLYRCHTNVTRKFADEVLYSALLVEGVTNITAFKFYVGVRFFGSWHFDKNNKDC